VAFGEVAGKIRHDARSCPRASGAISVSRLDTLLAEVRDRYRGIGELRALETARPGSRDEIRQRRQNDHIALADAETAEDVGETIGQCPRSM
jgi:hypothetical protein